MNKRDFEDVEAGECTDDDTLGESAVEQSDNEKEKEPEQGEPPKKKFRIQARQLALTYARTGGAVTKEMAFDQLREKLGDPTEFLIAQETHKVVVLSMRDHYNQQVQEAMSLYPKIPKSFY